MIPATVRKITANGNGVATAFGFTFKVFGKADVQVVKTSTLGVESTLTLDSNYSLTLNANQETSPGGTVTYPISGTPLATGEKLTILGNTATSQNLDIHNLGFQPQTLEDAMDRLTILIQQVDEEIDRAVKWPTSDENTAVELPSAENRASKFLAFDAAGGPVATSGTPGTVPVSAFMQTVLDDTTQSAAQDTLGASAIGKSLFGAASAAAARSAINAEVVGAVNVGYPALGRLTLTSGVPVTTGDVTAAATVYLTPYKGNVLALYDGAAWDVLSYTEKSIAVPATTNTLYDVFAYNNAGVVTLELTAWTNDTTRATALVIQDGVYCKSGILTRRYLGSFRTTGVSGQTEDSITKRYVWNYHNQVPRPMRAVDTTNSWVYTTAAWRQANANAANQLDCVVGVAEQPIIIRAAGAIASTIGGGAWNAAGIGIDSTTVNSWQICTSGDKTYINNSELSTFQTGRHFFPWLEYGISGGVFYGDNGSAFLMQSGISGTLMG